VIERCLLDTDILIEYLRGSQQAADFVESLTGDLLLSIITVAELYSGVRDELEEKSIEQFLLAFEVIAIDQTIARRAGLLRRDFRQSHGTGLADALIAASAEKAQATLVTFNDRHFQTPSLSDAGPRPRTVR
jgi:hypothetical protein